MQGRGKCGSGRRNEVSLEDSNPHLTKWFCILCQEETAKTAGDRDILRTIPISGHGLAFEAVKELMTLDLSLDGSVELSINLARPYASSLKIHWLGRSNM